MAGKAIYIKCGNPICGNVLKIDSSKVNGESPLVKCPKCKSANRVKLPKPQKETAAKAWLVRHTENRPATTFDLKMGKNTIGRKALGPGYPVPDIQLSKEDDPYVSRGVHCTLEIAETNGRIEAVISDNGSSNGSFINSKAHRLKPGDEEYLEDGETVQVGRTKFVLKTNQSAASKNEARTLVGQTDYSETIIA